MIYLAFLKRAQVVTVAPDIIFKFKMVGRNDHDFVFEIRKTKVFFSPNPQKASDISQVKIWSLAMLVARKIEHKMIMIGY